MFRKFLILLVILTLPGLAAAGMFAVWGYNYIMRDLPQLDRVEDYRPPAVTSVYAADGTLAAEFYNERRYPARLSEIPVYVRNCFLAAEDATFYSHPGIDLVSIVRAFVKNLQTGAAKQGGSTITQQVVKNLLLSSEKKLVRKLKEAILSYQIEQKLTKDDILEIYLNQIYFGAGAYGIKAASKIYFHKDPKDLTLAEGAMLAGLPKAPSRYSPITNMRKAKDRQKYVLAQMARVQFISAQAARDARLEEVQVYSPSAQNIFHAPYYVSEVRRIFSNDERWKHLSLDTDGLKIFTPLDLKASQYASKALRAGLREVDKRRGWRGPIQNYAALDKELFDKEYEQLITAAERGEPFPAMVTRISGLELDVYFLGKHSTISLKEAAWAKKRRISRTEAHYQEPLQTLRVGDVIEISEVVEGDLKEGEVKDSQLRYRLDQTPDLEGAATILDPNSGRVVAMVGGYDYARSQFNRVTQSFRQPGSAFKPVVYLAAIDGFRYTPATIVYDTPRTFKIGDQLWSPGNFDGKFLGGIPLRSALEKSRNLVSADIISRIGVDAAINYARKLGITSRLGQNLSLSLGSSEVTLLEMTRAYGVFANKGVLFDSVLIDRIEDRFGNKIYDYEDERFEKAKQVIDERSAFLMANLMKGVVQNGTGWKVRELGRPAAGKTGTSNDLMDTWFIGYTPNWTAGVWVGFDVKITIGDQETGGRVSAPIWLNMMKPFLEQKDQERYEELVTQAKEEAELLGIEYQQPEKLEPLDFSVPEGIDPMWVSRSTGRPSDAQDPNAVYEYFVSGTEPTWEHGGAQASEDYLNSPDL